MVMKPRFLALLISVALVILIVDLVRRRRLREEYSWLWISMSAAMVAIALWPGLLRFISGKIGAVFSTSTLFFFALIFLVFINIQFSVEISTLRTQVKNLAQKLALLEEGEKEPSVRPETEEQ